MAYSTIKDLIIYLVPGTLLNIIILAILFDQNAIVVITYFELLKSELFISSFLIFSILSGFIQSQLQITLINRIIYRKRDMRLIKNQNFPKQIKTNLAERIINEFGITEETIEEVKQNSDYFYQCLTVIHLGEYKRIHEIMERAVAISQFASAIILPLILGIYYIFSKVVFVWYFKWISFAFLSILAISTCYSTVKRFRALWIENVYKAFLHRATISNEPKY